jgi:hypothetical protein
MSSSVAVGFITIIIWVSTPMERVRKSGLSVALDPEVSLMDSAHAPAERLDKSPGAVGVDTAAGPERGV